MSTTRFLHKQHQRHPQGFPGQSPGHTRCNGKKIVVVFPPKDERDFATAKAQVKGPCKDSTATAETKAVLDQKNTFVATQAPQPVEVKDAKDGKETKEATPSARAKRAAPAATAIAGGVPTPANLLAQRIATTDPTENAFACAIGLYPRRIADILAVNRRLTADTALHLAHYFREDPMVCDRDGSSVLANAGVAAPGSLRKHDMSDSAYTSTVLGTAHRAAGRNGSGYKRSRSRTPRFDRWHNEHSSLTCLRLQSCAHKPHGR